MGTQIVVNILFTASLVIMTIAYLKLGHDYAVFRRENEVRERYETREQKRKEAYCMHCKHALIVKRQRGIKTIVTGLECAAAPQCPNFEKGCGEEKLLKELDSEEIQKKREQAGL